MCFYAFAVVLIVWMLWGYHMAFGNSLFSGPLANFFGTPTPALGADAELGQATIPLAAAAAFPPLHYAGSAMIYFQFVFAAITPLLHRGLGARTHEFQGVDDLRPRLEHVRLFDRRVLDLGRRVALATRRARLFGRLRHPSRRRRLRLRRGGGRRAAPARRPSGFRTEQSDHGLRGRRHPLARLERLQRRRPVLRQRRCGGGRPQYQHRDGDRDARLARARLRRLRRSRTRCR